VRGELYGRHSFLSHHLPKRRLAVITQPGHDFSCRVETIQFRLRRPAVEADLQLERTTCERCDQNRVALAQLLEGLVDEVRNHRRSELGGQGGRAFVDHALTIAAFGKRFVSQLAGTTAPGEAMASGWRMLRRREPEVSLSLPDQCRDSTPRQGERSQIDAALAHQDLPCDSPSVPLSIVDAASHSRLQPENGRRSS